MESSINLDQPFLEQQFVRELLYLTTEELSPKVRLDDLLKVARVAICTELLRCGCAESDLTGLSLGYTVSNPQDETLQKTYSVDWKLPPVSMGDSQANSNAQSSFRAC
jgi:hypothetical protein